MGGWKIVVSHRLLIKCSGELVSSPGSPFSASSLDTLAAAFLDLSERSVPYAIVIGAGNLLRGSRTPLHARRLIADHIGMLGTEMNALALQIMRNSDPMLVTASTWKNAANRQGINLKELYLQYKMTSKKSVKAIHEFDAAMMAVYRLYISLDRTPFFGFDVHSFIDKVWASPRL